MNKHGLVMFLALFVLLVACRFGQPMGQDEISHYYKCIRMLYLDGYSHPADVITFSPHLYPLLACGVCKLTGHFNQAAVQMTGVFCWLAVICLLWKLAKTTQEQWVACGLCALLPMVQQAAVTVEIDQTVLPLVTLLLCWRAKEFMEESSVKNGLWLAASMALALWARLTTPIVLIPLFVGFAWWSTDPKKAVMTAVWLAVGCVVFFVTWRLYCLMTGVNWFGPFEYLARSFRETTVGERASGASRLVQNMLYLVFWGMNPFLIVLTAGSVIVGYLKKGPRTELCYLAAGVWLLCGYEVVGGALFGFPKYQIPAMPLICLGIALAWKDMWKFRLLERREIEYLVGLAILALLAMAFLGDPLHAMRIDIRETAAIGGAIRLEFMKLGARFAVCWGALLVGFVIVRRRLRLAVWQLLLFCVLWTNGVFSIWQGNCAYSTGYVYGDAGETRQLAEWIVYNRKNKHLLLMPHEVLFQMDDFHLVDGLPMDWTDMNAVAERIETEYPTMIALSVLTNTTSEVREALRNEKMQKILHSDYRMSCFGRYYVWDRNLR
jgi:4-amino-4-deoxy-L-arabinose transferase-like glycosyltransferase